ncbi:MAG: hypothetical protein AB1758_23025 [Candidatus Eremiobacterota bacterium]
MEIRTADLRARLERRLEELTPYEASPANRAACARLEDTLGVLRAVPGETLDAMRGHLSRAAAEARGRRDWMLAGAGASLAGGIVGTAFLHPLWAATMIPGALCLLGAAVASERHDGARRALGLLEGLDRPASSAPANLLGLEGLQGTDDRDLLESLIRSTLHVVESRPDLPELAASRQVLTEDLEAVRGLPSGSLSELKVELERRLDGSRKAMGRTTRAFFGSLGLAVVAGLASAVTGAPTVGVWVAALTTAATLGTLGLAIVQSAHRDKAAAGLSVLRQWELPLESARRVASSPEELRRLVAGDSAALEVKQGFLTVGGVRVRVRR